MIQAISILSLIAFCFLREIRNAIINALIDAMALIISTGLVYRFENYQKMMKIYNLY